mmetsp:Transcript_20879/g.51055  ORF Transcript_20879/g.51055 Transcript_20879/m.51055 type:complete len:194 (-) Transcript_20879:497-1078(-)|eukprot:CAMPEP_0198366026 /NCGR_PEP_ID=MMETSP1450-20131203/154473_1 /TAXON_ID=753684 ORGANISM="Madagascaria erythrocladiodes, Strain CCMP3234" /NCGR_SAMPLE_ID=MMETSP1450 /ASSEMBLY_ACC=CAM_ASM_001115 /LENGTH=193 /DNA_ID=CAMNT_0044073489 /DNA_START=448 /DNA_END=1029 /DNA_ORIENTATION=-
MPSTNDERSVERLRFRTFFAFYGSLVVFVGGLLIGLMRMPSPRSEEATEPKLDDGKVVMVVGFVAAAIGFVGICSTSLFMFLHRGTLLQDIRPAFLKIKRRGMPPELVDEIMAESKRKRREGEICAICLEGTEDAQPGSADTDIVQLVCGHRMDEACLRTWFQRSCACPICKRDLCIRDEGAVATSKDTTDAV